MTPVAFLADRAALLTEIAAIERDLQALEAQTGGFHAAADVLEIRSRLQAVARQIAEQIATWAPAAPADPTLH